MLMVKHSQRFLLMRQARGQYFVFNDKIKLRGTEALEVIYLADYLYMNYYNISYTFMIWDLMFIIQYIELYIFMH